MSKGDTQSYVANAAAMCGERSQGTLTAYDIRVFPGYPVLIATLHKSGFSLAGSALLVTWISAGTAAAVAAALFNDARVGWAMTCLIPHYLINSSLGMSEAPLLAAVLLALLAATRNQFLASALLFAFAGMIRPMACFALLGMLLALARQRRWMTALCLGGMTCLFFCLELGLYQWWTGDALRGIHAYANHPDAYAGHLLAWPFQSLLTTPGRDGASTGKICYIWTHVLLILTACTLIVFQTWRTPTRNQSNVIACGWLLCNTAFVLCIGSVWGFRHFPRFSIPAAPALFWTLRDYLPRRKAAWMFIAIMCEIFAALGAIDAS